MPKRLSSFLILFAILLYFGQSVSASSCAKAPQSCNCSDQEKEPPVCLSNGYTYYTTCELNCAMNNCHDLKLAHKGECQRAKKERCCKSFCPDIYSPVCGNDLSLYNNSCEFECERRCNPELKEMSQSLQRHYQILKFCK